MTQSLRADTRSQVCGRLFLLWYLAIWAEWKLLLPFSSTALPFSSPSIELGLTGRKTCGQAVNAHLGFPWPSDCFSFQTWFPFYPLAFGVSGGLEAS